MLHHLREMLFKSLLMPLSLLHSSLPRSMTRDKKNWLAKCHEGKQEVHEVVLIWQVAGK